MACICMVAAVLNQICVGMQWENIWFMKSLDISFNNRYMPCT